MPRYRKLGYVALNVSDLARARTFYEGQLGLQPSGEGAHGEAFFRCGFEHHAIALYHGTEPGLKRIGFELETPASVEDAARHFAAEGLEVAELAPGECAALHIDRAFRIVEPFTGATFEFYGAMREFSDPYVPRLAKIQRIGHVVFKVADLAGASDFYTGVLGFKVSDQIDGQACFMRCHPSPFHHGVALVKAAAPQLHHVNFMVTEVDDIGRAIARFAKNGVRVVYGPGRHPPSGSMFLYFLEPDGLTLEYSFGMEEFPELEARRPRLFEPIRDSYDYWASFRDLERYAAVGAIERAARPAPRRAAKEPARA
ncbi:MAG TPA: VOC family protein [Stellaceae bacterium]|nr:VOC family protein [Stellaceae bacterium]